jgi:hypothetical protein
MGKSGISGKPQGLIGDSKIIPSEKTHQIYI